MLLGSTLNLQWIYILKKYELALIYIFNVNLCKAPWGHSQNKGHTLDPHLGNVYPCVWALPIIKQEAKVIINLNIHRSRGHRKGRVLMPICRAQDQIGIRSLSLSLPFSKRKSPMNIHEIKVPSKYT